MSTTENTALVHRFNDELWNKGHTAVIDELFAGDWSWHGAPGMPPDRDGLMAMTTGFRAAFVDIRCTVEDAIAQGDKVAWRWTFRGRHTGELMGMPPTGQQVVFTGISIDRIAAGRFAERWDSPDLLGLMQQLGAVPAPAVTA